jgi:low affinity Fe/Cu permease
MELILQVTVAIITVAGFLYVLNKQRDMHLAMNSRLDELLKTTSNLARAERFTAGQKDRLDALRDAGSNLEKR